MHGVLFVYIDMCRCVFVCRLYKTRTSICSVCVWTIACSLAPSRVFQPFAHLGNVSCYFGLNRIAYYIYIPN